MAAAAWQRCPKGLTGRRIRIHGTVQGVGFRPWVFRVACEVGITGHVLNDTGGVTIHAFGAPDQVAAFEARLTGPLPPAARIVAIHASDIPAEPAAGFQIVDSRAEADRRVSIPPDLATCDRCAAEIRDRSNRRVAYAFTNCTNCGPRFTIARDIPYDRAATSMAGFTMCPECRREYEDPADRRFHAEPNACPACGPRLSLLTNEGSPIAVADPVAAAAEALRTGLIVAVKGIGGFHLACDATSEAAVATLRVRKRRDEKPLAIMVRDDDAARAVAAVGNEEHALLTSVERPIVLVPRRPGSGLAENVAPRNELVGLMLPYSPLHHLLLAEVGRPLVMTSGNVSDEPIAFTNDEAVRRLGGIADLLLVHDREIENRCDDSVARVIARKPVVFRRSRGYVPRAIPLATPIERPVLACGALLKNTFCLASGDDAWLGPHIGDLENLETFDSYDESITRLERFLQIAPEVIAHDLHPDYLSTAYARRRPEAIKVAVQHHHAHVASAMAEHGLLGAGRVIGIAYDGTGYGTDGTSWGGEVLLADEAGYSRVATFRPLPLVGGDRAIREPWRLAVALLDDAFDGEPPVDPASLFPDVDPSDLQLARELLQLRLHTPLARGVGRYFDAFGAVFLQRPIARFEGQVALEWDQVAGPQTRPAYPFTIHGDGGLLELDLRPAVRAAVTDWLAGRAAPLLSAAFHQTLVDATADLVRRAIQRHGRHPVVATGGCFQNARLAEGVVAALAPDVEVKLHGEVPPGDGGIALGQAVVAGAMVRMQSAAAPIIV